MFPSATAPLPLHSYSFLFSTLFCLFSYSRYLAISRRSTMFPSATALHPLHCPFSFSFLSLFFCHCSSSSSPLLLPFLSFSFLRYSACSHIPPRRSTMFPSATAPLLLHFLSLFHIILFLSMFHIIYIILILSSYVPHYSSSFIIILVLIFPQPCQLSQVDHRELPHDAGRAGWRVSGGSGGILNALEHAVGREEYGEATL